MAALPSDFRSKLPEAKSAAPNPPDFSFDEPSEDAIAALFTLHFARTLRFDHDVGQWFQWDGTRWKLEGTALVFDYIRRVARSLGDGERSAGRASVARGVEAFAKADRAHAVTSEAWDQNPWLLGTPGGTVDLRSGALSPADPSDHISKITSVAPVPGGDMKIICAGSSDEGLAFSAQYADYAFCLGKGVNTPAAFAPNNERLMAATAKTGRDVRIYALFMVIAAETDEEAMEKWISYREGVDEEAVSWLGAQGAADKTSATTNVRQLADRESAVNLNMGTLVGSYEGVARMLDEAATVPNTGGVLLTFDDFIEGTEAFGTRIQPLMKCRQKN